MNAFLHQCLHSAHTADCAKKSLFTRAITILLLALFALPAFAGTIYVATDGNDNTGDGSSSKPYRTIAKAASVVTAGTTVLVRAGTYVEENIQPKVSGADGNMIVFKPAPGAAGLVIIKHNDTFTGSTVTQAVKDKWLADNGWTAAQTTHYTNEGIEYSIADRANKLTDVFNLFGRNYIWIEGFIFRDYKYARNTININGTGNVVINCSFVNLGCVYNSKWHWTGGGVYRGDCTVPVEGTLNAVRNCYFQSVYGETMSYDGYAKDNIITENTFIGAIGKNGDAGGSESSTLGGRFENNLNNAFAFNYSGGSVNGGTIWLDVCVNDFTAVRNVAHNTAYFFFNESGCTRNWAYENIVYNKPRGANNRMPSDANFFTDFPAQHINTGLYTAFWDTGSTWDARWVGNVTYNLREGINVERSWRDEVRNNIGYEDNNTQHSGETLGLRIFETSVVGFHNLHALDLKGGGPQIIKNNLWYSTKKANFVRYMYPTQQATTVANFNKLINSTSELGVDPLFEDVSKYDFRLKSGSPAKGTGYNGVDRGAYMVYPKTDVGYNKNLGLIEDINAYFGKLNTSIKPNKTATIEVKLTKNATKSMTFKIEPVAGDARLGTDFRLSTQTVTFAAGERSKSITLEALQPNSLDEIDQLVVLRIVPVSGSTSLNEVGGMNIHLVKIIRVTKYSVTLNDIGDSMGKSIVMYFSPGETVTIDAKTRPNYTFSKWNTGYHYVKTPVASVNSARTTFTMPEYNVTLQALWTLNGTKVNVTGISVNPTTLSLVAGATHTVTSTIQPSNATDQAVLWTSSNPLVATVSSTGVVTAVGAGTADIKVTALDSKYGNNQYRTATCKVTVTGTYTPPPVAETMRTDGYYTIKNVNSNRYLVVAGTIASGANVEQGATAHNNAASAMWKLTDAGSGYYVLRPQSNENLAIDVYGAVADNDANINLWTYNGNSNQQYKFVKVSDGVYTIRTKISNDASCLDVANASTAQGGNVLQWTSTGGTNQQWIIEWHESIAALTGTATISNTAPRIGDVLTASLASGNNTGTLSYVWKVGGT
ncbi:MAG: RICIN domain-containing protein, partial [Bacteroidales bacterium]|nr:RICIN domain-containing protein [Bacteroidales bacterium]